MGTAQNPQRRVQRLPSIMKVDVSRPTATQKAKSYLVEAIKPAVIEAQSQPGDLLDNAVRANVALEVEYLKSSSQIISQALGQGTIGLVGARYDLGTGAVNVIT